MLRIGRLLRKGTALARDSLYMNSLHIIMNNVLSAALGFFFWFIAARLYAPADVGIASTLISAMVMLGILSGTGFRIGLMRFMPGSTSAARMLNTCITVVAVISALLALLFLLLRHAISPALAQVLESPSVSAGFLIFAVSFSVSLLIEGAFIAGRLAKYVLLKNVLANTLKIPIPIFLIPLGAGGIFAGWGVATTLMLLVALLVFMPRVVRGYTLRPAMDTRIMSEMVRFSAGNHLSGVLSAAPSLVMPVLITNRLSPEMAAYFYVSWMITNLLYMVPIGTSYSLLAEASADVRRTGEKVMKALRFMFAITLPGALAVVLLADYLLMLFGSSYTAEAGTLLRLLALSSIPMVLIRTYIALRNVQKRVSRVVGVNAFLATGIISTAYLLMPVLGLSGVGLAWLCTNSVLMVVLAVILYSELRSRP
ncbi:MAG: lipopolysaccharide biosynthesis protein [Euryarchaeota archaeon]|nr:lipopolysaccharide biosynthesis protein [Euryarchaeota archaeon]